MTNFLESIHSSSLISKVGANILTKDQLNILEDTAFSTSDYKLADHQARISFYKLSSYDYTYKNGIVTGAEDLYTCSKKKSSTNFEKIKYTDMDNAHLDLLVEYYSVCYPSHSFTKIFHLSNLSANIPPSIYHFVKGNIKVAKTFQLDITYSSRRAKSMKGAYIQSFFNGPQDNDPVASYYGEIQYFFQHQLTINKKKIDHHFAFVKWFRLFSSNISGGGEKTMELCKGYEDPAMHRILPVHRIYSQITVACSKNNSTNPRISAGCIVIIPQEKKLFV